MSRRAYPSDLTNSQWAMLEPLIPSPAEEAPNLTYERREIVNAILYVLPSGCSWRLLPHVSQLGAPSTGSLEGLIGTGSRQVFGGWRLSDPGLELHYERLVFRKGQQRIVYAVVSDCFNYVKLSQILRKDPTNRA
ncbi:transposase [Ktedonospora formicarum]|uniref:Insertion element IS402-like domain-containing protein n=1 Tax=Ktedonospora formicarum TaxID=2778364 RepID=A0A8J3I4U5_9CHLR|nr:transposase [Ktedonospora formicarum]GHO50297.1 hypothetical protein KSX_84600 [Ktedonospora formicarum]